jgi:hypothetical protein
LLEESEVKGVWKTPATQLSRKRRLMFLGDRIENALAKTPTSAPTIVQPGDLVVRISFASLIEG